MVKFKPGWCGFENKWKGKKTLGIENYLEDFGYKGK